MLIISPQQATAKFQYKIKCARSAYITSAAPLYQIMSNSKLTPSYVVYRSPSYLRSMGSTASQSPAPNGLPCGLPVPHFPRCNPPAKTTYLEVQANPYPQTISPIKEKDWRKFRTNILGNNEPAEKKANNSHGDDSNYDSNSSESDYEPENKKPTPSTFRPHAVIAESQKTLAIPLSPAPTKPHLVPGTSAVKPRIGLVPVVDFRSGSVLVLNQRGVKKALRRVSSFMEQDDLKFELKLTRIEEEKLRDDSEQKREDARKKWGEHMFGATQAEVREKVKVRLPPKEEKKRYSMLDSIKNDRAVLWSVYGKPTSTNKGKEIVVRKMLIKKSNNSGFVKKPPTTPPRRKSDMFSIPEAPHKALLDESDMSVEKLGA